MKLTPPRETTGNITVKDKAIAEIVGLAALQVPGVVKLKGNPAEELIEMLWKNLSYTGVRITLHEREIAISLSVSVKYGFNLSEVASQVQDKVREAVESMTGLTSSDIHVTIAQIQPQCAPASVVGCGRAN